MNKALATLIFQKIMGWKIIGNFPEGVKKAIIVVAPHTSNKDFWRGIFSRSIQKFPANFLIKDDWLKKPILGNILVNMGGVGVDRSKNTKMTDQIADLFGEREEFVLAIAPEGTRKYNPNWKTGFWYIAKKAGVPLIPATFDYPTKRVIWFDPFYPSDDIEADFKKLKDLFRPYKGAVPENGIRDED